MDEFSDRKIVDSWAKNARPWIAAIEQQQIESRALVTNQAIIDAVMSVSARKVLDIGCGEGWLVRALVARGLSVTGIDVIVELVNAARAHDLGEFRVLDYQDISAERFDGQFDLAVCNFSLLGNESVEHVFKGVREVLCENGVIIVQTLHPHMSGAAQEDQNYKDGWRKGSWSGFSGEFCDPAPWYFRTMQSWLNLIEHSKFELLRIVEPPDPRTGHKASVIFTARRR